MQHTIIRLFTVLVAIVILQTVFLLRLANNVEYHGTEISDNSKSDNSQNKNYAEKIADDPVALFTLVLTAFTGGLYMATQSLSTSTKELVADARKSSERQLRAYLCFSGYDGITFRDELIENRMDSIGVAGKFKNAGNTPALKVTIVTVPLVIDNTDETRVIFEIAGNIDNIFTTAGIGAEFYGHHVRFTRAEIIKLKEGRARFFVYCCAYYTHVFSDELQKEERCVELKLRNDPLVFREVPVEIFYYMVFTKFLTKNV